MEIRNQAINSLAWSFSQQFSFQFINFFVSILLARILLPEEFGLIAMIGVFLAIGQALVDGGLSSSLIRTSNVDEQDYSTIFYINLLGALILYLVMFFLAPTISIFFNESELVTITRILCLIFIIQAFSTIQSTRLNKNLRFKTQFSINIPSLILGSIVGIWMAYNGFGVWSLVWMNLTKALIATVLLWIMSKWRPGFTFSKEKYLNHLSFGYKIAFTGIINAVFNNTYTIIIGKYFTAAMLGFYTRANSIKDLPVSNLINGFNKVSYPLLSQISHDETKLKSVYRRLMIQVIFWVAPVLVIAGVVAEPLFRLLLTEKWLPAVPFFQIIIIAGLFEPLNQFCFNICSVRGRSDIILKLSFFKNVISFVVAIISVWFGIYALLWSIVVVSVIVTIVNIKYSGKLINYSVVEHLKDVLPILIVAVFSGGVAYLTQKIIISFSSGDIQRILFPFVSSIVFYLTMQTFIGSIAITDIKKAISDKWKRD